MRTHYHDLLGKRVVAADGRQLGRIVDLVAERRGERLCVTALLVGRAGLARRIGVARWPLRRLHLAPSHRIPWRLVTRIGGEVYLAGNEPPVAAREAGAQHDVCRARPDDGQRPQGPPA